MKELMVRIAGVEFKNPVVAAAGHPTHTGKLMRKCIEAGVGAVVSKTTTLDKSYHAWCRANPCFLDKYGEPGVHYMPEGAFRSHDQAKKDIKEVKLLADREDVVVIGSIFEPIDKLNDWEKSARLVEDSGADMVELLFWCPVRYHTDMAQLPRDQAAVVKTVKEAVGIPVYPKVTMEHWHLLPDQVRACEKAGADAFHSYAHYMGTIIDIETGRPLVPRSIIGGRITRGYGVHTTWLAAKTAKVPILSSGGIYTWRDAVERMMAGASLVVVHSAAVYWGYKAFKDILNGMKVFLESKAQYEKVEDLIGVATPHIENEKEFTAWTKAHSTSPGNIAINVDASRCTGCGRCTVCNWDAMTVEAGTAKVNALTCVRCGVCASLCPFNAITLEIKKRNL